MSPKKRGGPAGRGLRHYDLRMLSIADQLFNDYDALPVRYVFQALTEARMRLRDRGQPVPDPDEVDGLARQLLALRPPEEARASTGECGCAFGLVDPLVCQCSPRTP